MERYFTVIGTIQRSKFKAWLRKQLKKYEDLNLISHTMVPAEAKTVMSTLIFEEPLGAMIDQFEMLNNILEEEEE